MADKDIQNLKPIDPEVYAKMAATFEDMERFSNDYPESFRFFVSKYEPVLFQGFDWSAHLFPPENIQENILQKFVPWIVGIFVVINIILTVVTRK